MSPICPSCDNCTQLLAKLNAKLVTIADHRLYNIRFELGRYVDYKLFKLLSFYKPILEDICSGTDCDCYASSSDETDAILERIKILVY